MNTIKTGVIGTGHLGRFHALNYAQIPQADLVGVYDSDAKKAAAVAAESQCRPYNSMDDLLKDVDAVSIAVPTDKHFAVCDESLNHGVHCLVEKPIARDLAEADAMIALASQKNLHLQVGQIERFNPAVRALAPFALQPQFIESHRLAQFNPRGTEVSVVLDLMIHDIDMILHLVQSPVAGVDASGVAVVSNTVDIANVRLKFLNGAVANLTASRISQKQMRKMRLFQKDTYVTIDFLQKSSEIYRLQESGEQADMILGEIGVGKNKKNIVYFRPEAPQELGLEVELDLFLRSIRGEQVPAVTGKEGRDALDVALQVLQQMEESA